MMGWGFGPFFSLLLLICDDDDYDHYDRIEVVDWTELGGLGTFFEEGRKKEKLKSKYKSKRKDGVLNFICVWMDGRVDGWMY